MRSWLPPALLTAGIFLLTRVPALGLATHDSDAQLVYARFAAEWHAGPW